MGNPDSFSKQSMFKKFMSYFGGAASKIGQGTKKKPRKQKAQQSNVHNPFGDFFKDIKTQTVHKHMETEEALLILNFQKATIPTVEEIEERYQAYYLLNTPQEEGSVYLQSKIKNAKSTLMVDLYQVEPEPEPQTLEEKRPELEKILQSYLQDGEDISLRHETWNSLYLDLVRTGAVKGVESVGDGSVKVEDLTEDMKSDIEKVYTQVGKNKDGKISFDELFDFLKVNLEDQSRDTDKETESTTETDSGTKTDDKK